MQKLLSRRSPGGRPTGPARPAQSAVEGLEPRTLFSTTGPALTVNNLDVLPGPERMVFNRVQVQPPAVRVNADGSRYQPPNNLVHDKGTLQLRNTGTSPLVISSLSVSGPWKIVSAPATTIAPGGSTTVTLQFVATSEPAHSYNETAGPYNPDKGGAWFGSLTLGTNDPTNAKYVEQLAGWWQQQSELSEEPSLQSIVNLLGDFKTNISNSIQPTYDEPSGRKLFGEEVYVPYFKAANAAQPVGVYDLASWHQQGSPVTVAWYPQGGRNGPTVFTVAGAAGQSFLPGVEGNPGHWAAGTFSPGTQGFGFKIDYERTDDTMNVTGGGGGHHVREYPVRDHTGAIIPNTWFVCLDYSPGSSSPGENFDFQDQVLIVTNARPANGATPTPGPTPTPTPVPVPTPTPTPTSSVTLAASADAYVQNGSFAGSNFGSSSQLLVKDAVSPYNRVAYLTFDLSHITSTTFTSATLNLTGALQNGNDSSFRINVLAVPTTTWGEKTIAAANAPAVGGVVASASIPDMTRRVYHIDLTAYVRQQLAAGKKQISIALAGTAFTNAMAAFDSREDGATGPQLAIK